MAWFTYCSLRQIDYKKLRCIKAISVLLVSICVYIFLLYGNKGKKWFDSVSRLVLFFYNLSNFYLES